MPEKIEELVRAALAAAQEGCDLPHSSLRIVAWSDRPTLLMASGPPLAR